MMIESLESRSLMSVDLTLQTFTSTLPPSGTAGALTKLKGAVKVNVVNSGTEVLPKTTPAAGVSVFLRSTGGVETLVGSIKPVKFGGLKVGAHKTASISVSLAAGAAASLTTGGYTLVARVDPTNAVAESSETNNDLAGKAFTVGRPGAGILDANYGITDNLTFTRTRDNSSGGNFSEEGNFVDSAGGTGTYLYTMSGPNFGYYLVSLTIFPSHANQVTQTLNAVYSGKRAGPHVIGGMHAAFAAKSNGGLAVHTTGTSAGLNAFVKFS